MVLTSIKSIKSVGCVSPVLTGPVCRPAAECPGTDEVLLCSSSVALRPSTRQHLTALLSPDVISPLSTDFSVSASGADGVVRAPGQTDPRVLTDSR